MLDSARKDEPLLPENSTASPRPRLSWLLALLLVLQLFTGALERLCFARMTAVVPHGIVLAHTLLAAFSAILFMFLRLARSQSQMATLSSQLQRVNVKELVPIAALDALHSLLLIEVKIKNNKKRLIHANRSRPPNVPQRFFSHVHHTLSRPTPTPHPLGRGEHFGHRAVDASSGVRPRHTPPPSRAPLLSASAAAAAAVPARGLRVRYRRLRPLPPRTRRKRLPHRGTQAMVARRIGARTADRRFGGGGGGTSIPAHELPPPFPQLIFLVGVALGSFSSVSKRRLLERNPIDMLVLNSWLSSLQVSFEHAPNPQPTPPHLNHPLSTRQHPLHNISD
mgnify:CR=1 FL=1